MDSDPAQRNIFGLIQSHPEMARDGIQLRKFGQQIIELLGGKRIHPAWIVPGGVNEPLSAAKREQILAMLPEAQEIAVRALDWFKKAMASYQDEIQSFANFPSLFMGLVSADGGLEHYDGKIRLTDSAGNLIRVGVDPEDYLEFIDETVEPWTYLKFTFYKPLGYPGGMYRVGPLARINVVDCCGTPMADEALSEFREKWLETRSSSFHYHYARLIEILFAIERMQELLNDADILSPRVRAQAGPNSLEGIGVSEAPRGTLIHHYKIDENGLITWANLIIATGHNNLAMNRGVLQVAKRYVNSQHLTEGMLNRVEAVIRTFDPCLSCSTHALGQMPMQIQLIGPDGTLLDELTR
jgi:NAD-reducing hydrogenase large subunit